MHQNRARQRYLSRAVFPSASLCVAALGYLAWSFVVVLAYIYNVFSIVLRAAFDIYYTERNASAWLTADYVCDAVYLFDLVLVKPRIQCISNGLTEVGAPHRIPSLAAPLSVNTEFAQILSRVHC